MKKILCSLLLPLFTTSTARKIIILRHGNSDNNVGKYYDSNPELPNHRGSHLTELGKSQAKDAALGLKKMEFDEHTIAHVFVSPLTRAQETAAIVCDELGKKLTPTIDKKITEIGMGTREGHHYSEFTNDPWDMSLAQMYGGETVEQLKARLTDFYKSILDKTTGNILVVTHGSPALELIKIISKKDNIKLEQGQFKIFPIK